MPYSNFPPEISTDKIDSCVHDVMGKGHPKPAAIAICYDSLVKGKEFSQAIKEYTEKVREFVEKATAEDNNLPDSAFLYVESGGEKDAEGKTTPRSLRHLPYRTASGAVDLPHLRNALSRLGQRDTGDTGGDKWLTASLRDELIAKARRILENSQKEMILPDGIDVPTLLQGVEDSLNAELSDEELQAVEQVYRDIEAGKVKIESLADPDAVTDKAQTFPRAGGSPGPAGNPSGTPGGSQGSHSSKQERCFLHVKKLGGNEEAARRICRSMFGEKAQKETAHDATFSVYKQADGHYRWVIFSSSSYRDREGEIVSQKALEQDTARMNFTGEYGVADWWHTPIVLGPCDFSAMEGRISVESGTFDDDWIGERLAAKSAELGASRSFYHPITEPDANGVYHNIQTFRRAILPQGRASNLLTQVYVAKENENMILDKVKELIDKLGGGPEAEAKVSALLDAAQTVDKAAETAGIAHKETEAEAAPEAKPEPEKAKEAPILEQPGMFIADMKPEEFSALMTKAMGDSQMATMAQIAEMMAQMQTMMKAMLGEAAMEQAKEIAALATKQAALETQVKELNGLTPRGYRATQDPATATNKDAKPAADEKANYFSQFVNGFVLGQPQPPVK